MLNVPSPPGLLVASYPLIGSLVGYGAFLMLYRSGNGMCEPLHTAMGPLPLSLVR